MTNGHGCGWVPNEEVFYHEHSIQDMMIEEAGCGVNPASNNTKLRYVL